MFKVLNQDLTHKEADNKQDFFFPHFALNIPYFPKVVFTKIIVNYVYYI